MIIAIDYDGTFTVNPDMWIDFIVNAKSHGFRVICPTMRFDNELERIDNKIFDEIIYTERKAKAQYLNSLGISVDIWIDDNPAWLFEDSF